MQGFHLRFLYFNTGTFLQKHKIYWWAWLNKKLMAFENTTKYRKALTPSMLQVSKPFSGHWYLMNTGIL